ncbi:hypothetical protein B0H11DRAFT_2215089 [Mycena galericulata]|nr:hypothetical protein B0H11DRAFT_2215089 [Mycena galericulata]
MRTKAKSKTPARGPGSADNPVLVNEEGIIVPTLMRASTPPLPCIFSTRAPAVPAVPAILQLRSRHAELWCPALLQLRDGYRVPREVPLMDAHIYLDAVRPPLQRTNRPHYECGICLNIKSHPVNYPCGHGHCYVCARKWLETSFDCPICRARITHAPTRNLDTEAAIAYDHPEWVDRSLINYSWGGLIFPTIAV